MVFDWRSFTLSSDVSTCFFFFQHGLRAYFYVDYITFTNLLIYLKKSFV